MHPFAPPLLSTYHSNVFMFSILILCIRIPTLTTEIQYQQTLWDSATPDFGGSASQVIHGRIHAQLLPPCPAVIVLIVWADSLALGGGGGLSWPRRRVNRCDWAVIVSPVIQAMSNKQTSVNAENVTQLKADRRPSRIPTNLSRQGR